MNLIKDAVTHKLVVKLTGGVKEIFLTLDESRKLRESMNSVDQFINIQGETYPKFGAEIVFLNKEEIVSYRKKYSNKGAYEEARRKIEESVEVENEKSEKISKWVSENEDRFSEMIDESYAELLSEDNDFSDAVLRQIAKGRARDDVFTLIKENDSNI